MTITVLCVGGIGESGPADTQHAVTGMLKNITDKLDPARFTAEWVPWIDQYGPVPNWNGVSYDETQRRIHAQLTDRLSRGGELERFLLLGYSAGAHAAGNVAAGLPRNVVGFLGLADPARQRLHWPAGYGITGERYITGADFPVWQIAHPDDFITSCPGGSPLRTLSDVTRGFSAVDLLPWGQALSEQVYQQWWRDPSLDWGSVAPGLAAYLAPYPWGTHTGYDHMRMPGTAMTYCEWAADQINGWQF